MVLILSMIQSAEADLPPDIRKQHTVFAGPLRKGSRTRCVICSMGKEYQEADS